MNTPPPLVSVIMPMRNEGAFIKRSLGSILANDYPADRLEVLVVDGDSDDTSPAQVDAMAARDPRVHRIVNPQRHQSAALNLGLKSAHGDIIVRMDAHTEYAADYLRHCVRLLQSTDAQNVGGVQRAVGETRVAQAIAAATSSRFGVGDAKFRYAATEAWVDTVYLGAFRRTTLEQLGGFNEGWLINEDYELNYRLRRAGGKILLSPDVRCKYYVRNSLTRLLQQYVRYGFWKVKTLLAHPAAVRWRQLVPPVFVLALVASALVAPIRVGVALIVPILYLLVNLTASVATARRHGWQLLPLLPLVFTTLHLAWGTGFWAGLIHFGLLRRSRP